MNNNSTPSSSKQYVISNPLRATRKATRLTVLLDDELCLRKLVRTEDLDKGAEIILEPRNTGGLSIMGATRLSLIDLEIPGAIGPLDDDSWGINIAAAQTNFPLQGLQLYLQPWSAMSIGDSYQIMLNGSTQVASGAITKAEDLGARVVAFVPSVRMTPGPHMLSYVIRRLGQQPETSDELPIFVKLDAPGGVDEDGSTPGHSELKFSLPADIEQDGVDKDAAAKGVIATVSPYPNMTAGDDIKLSWGGYFVHHVPVTPAEVGKAVEITVDEAIILAAGDSDADGLAVTFEVYDVVLNRSSDWSAEKRIVVDTGNSRLDAPIVAEVINGVLDLDVLGTEPATVQIWVTPANFAVGDMLVIRVAGTTSDGDAVEHEAEPVTVDRVNKVFEIPVSNPVLRRLAQVQAAFSYRRERAGVSASSRSQFANIIGQAVGMAAPIARDAAQGALDPALTRTAIEIPWDESMAAGDQITLRWIGTRPDLTIYDPALQPHAITGREETNKLPIVINVDGAHLKTLEGGTLQLYFELAKDVDGAIVVRESTRATLLNVGEPQAELPAPIVDGVTDGVIDPALPGTQLTVPRYPTMEIGDEVHYLWKGSVAGNEEDWIKINSFTKDNDVIFAIDKALIDDNDKGKVDAAYWVIRASGRRSDSDILSFQVGKGQAQLLPAPKVPGSEDGTLDVALVPNGATVVIPAWMPEMTPGDRAYLTWQHDDGSAFQLDRSVTGSAVGKDMNFTVPLDEVKKSVDGQVSVSYIVEPLAGDERPSQPWSFGVVEELPIQLPEPIIVEAVGGLLDPAKVPGGATVSIPAEALLKTGDTVTLTWAGQPGNGSVTPTVLVTKDGELSIPIDYATVKANDGFSVTLSYTVKRVDGSPDGPSPEKTYDVKSAIAAGLLNVMGARFSHCSYRASATPRWISAFNDTTGAPLTAEWQYEGDAAWTQANRWRDVKPEVALHVRTSDDHVLLYPVNIIGNGNDTTTVGDAALVAHRDRGDVVGWGHAAYGGTIPPAIITMDDIVAVCCTRSAYAARRRNGFVVAWGDATEGGSLGTVPLDNFVSLTSNSVAIAGIKSDGKVYAWGTAASGGTVPDAIKAYSDIQQIVGAGTAFAAIRGTGQVVAWGTAAAGGTVPAEIGTFTDIVQVSGNFTAFAALRANNRVVAWGTAANGGTVTTEVAQATVRELGASTARSFSLITTSGQVLAWGDASYGGTVPDDIKSLTDIVEVSATWQALAALRANGHVVAWGVAANGGTVPTHIALLNDIVQVVGNSKSFAALRRNGEVVAWGDKTVGGDITAVAAQLVKVKAVYGNSQSFVALRSDGEVVTWGNADGGGDSSTVQPYLRNQVSYEGSVIIPSQVLKAQGVINSEGRSHVVSPFGMFSFSASDWTKPQIAEAIGDVLDPGDDPDRSIVTHIVPGTLKYQDRVNLYLDNTLFDWTVVGRNGPGPGLDFEVPASEFMAYTGGQVRVWYSVIIAGETDEQPSNELLLTVSGGFEDDALLDLTAHRYVVAAHKAPAHIPDFARMQRAADWGTGPYTYSSSDDSIANINDSGTVTARVNGTCTITAQDSQRASRSYTLTIQGITVVHFLTPNTDWQGMNEACQAGGLQMASVSDLKALWNTYAQSIPVNEYLGWLPYPFWTSNEVGAVTYSTFDLSEDYEGDRTQSSDASERMQAVGISRTAAEQ